MFHPSTTKMSVFALVERISTLRKKCFSQMVKELNLKILSSKLEEIEWVLQDAEMRGFSDVSVKHWLERVDGIVYEIDNVLDEWEMANMQRSQEFSDPLAKARYFVISNCLCFKYAVGRREITKKMKALSGTIDKILEERNHYNFVSSFQGSKLDKFTSMVYDLRIFSGDVDKVYGRDLDKESLVKQLLTLETLEDDLINEGTQIVTIVGLGGVGKTTLAQLAYNDNRVKQNFQKQAWVGVTQPFDLSQVVKDILERVGSISADFHASDTFFRVYLYKALENKKFLIVLDSLWTIGRIEWECLSRCLRGAPGSKILVTTRDESVAKIIGSTLCLQLPLISDFDCWSIVKEQAFKRRTNDDCEKLMDIGFDIAKKLNGLPLAAKSVGRMLASRGSELQWRDVLNNPLWKHKDELSDLFHLLNLSYIDLCPLLKRCFLSCIVYSKRSSICIDRVIMIWMAYGYLNSSSNVDDMELKGLELFHQLVMRSFFGKSTENDEHGEDVVTYKMHDIVHDFANYLAGSEHNWIMDGDDKGRRTSDDMPFDSLGKLRTFSARYVSQNGLPLDLLSHLESVRVLSIIQCGLEQLPKGVGNLMHMRYLDLSCNPIQEVPESVTNLYNLQTLGLEHCYSLYKLPEGIDKLKKLRHLLNSGTFKLVQFPKGLENLIGLWTLSEFRITEASDIGYLRNLDQLRGSLRINFRRMRQIDSIFEEAQKANLKNKIHLQELELFFWDEVADDIVDALQPPPNLERFASRGIWGKWFSNWIDTSFNNLKVLSFDGLSICSELPPFGELPVLEKLTIISCNFKFLSTEFLGILKAQSPKRMGWFRRLMKLHFKECRSWEEWEDIDEEARDLVPFMARLRELKIHGCHVLKALPYNFLQQATSLQIFEVESCDCLEKRYSEESGPDRNKLSHIPHVRFGVK